LARGGEERNKPDVKGSLGLVSVEYAWPACEAHKIVQGNMRDEEKEGALGRA